MKTPILLLAVTATFVLSSCGATQGVYRKLDGSMVVVQNNGVLNKADSNAQHAEVKPDGTVLLTQQQAKPNNEVALRDYFVGYKLPLGIAQGFFKNDAITRNAEGTALVKGTKDPSAAIPENPNDGIVEVLPETPAP